MDILKTISQMQEWSKTRKKELKTICFVPTMGYLHQGHISLMEKGKSLCDELVISIFVNPAQFAPNEDLDTYPSNIKNDLVLARKAGVTAVFLPEKESIYPENFQTELKLQKLPQFLCGKFRPLFFSGVTMVVTKLFNIVMPDIAVFGQKDYQQLQIIRQLVLDLNFDIKIVAGDIIREKDGLAMSSRNAYLSDSQRASALCLSKSLNMARDMADQGEKNPEIIKLKMETFIGTFPETNIEYINFCDPKTLEDINVIESETLIAIVVKVGKTRLIDNILI
ncbi:MAG: pantoate--beta-alanine ligase [Desulfobacula sp.]|nr:pantoate--beta-alanine ligase [Desulfobacula sp.]